MDKGSRAYLFLKRRTGGGTLATPFLMSLEREYIQEIASSLPTFPDELKTAALEAITMDDVGWVVSGLGALAFVGQEGDIPAVEALLSHPNLYVTKAARTCLFEIRQARCRDLRSEA